MPEQFYELEQREHVNLLRGYEIKREEKRYQNAELIMMYMRSQSNKKHKSIDYILGNEKDQPKKSGRVVSLDEKRKELDYLTEILGEAVIR